MKQVSNKQAAKNRTLAGIKKKLPKQCTVCGRVADDLMHILPKSIWPEHYLNPENLVIGCREHHNEFDNSMNFRKLQTHLYKKVYAFDKLAANRYFGMN
jgi:5-methylcytosine-specific restriction endonuclease McrA